MRNYGLLNVIKELNEGTPPNTHNRGSQQIDFVLATARLFQDCIEQAGFLDCSVLVSDHKGMYADLNTHTLIGTGIDHLQRPHFRKLQLDDPRISYAYGKILHQQFVEHNVYRHVKCLSDAPKDVWDLSCEHKYEGVEYDVFVAMRYPEKIILSEKTAPHTMGKVNRRRNKCNNVLLCKSTKDQREAST
jgi:hypothetical protein